MNSHGKKLNEMNRLADMGHFPVPVNAGATMNVLLTLLVTWWIEPRFQEPWAPVVWVAIVLAGNLLPVVLLRLTDSDARPFPIVEQMDFWRDQHRFADWVYVAASANMAFWVLTGWAVFSLWHTLTALGSMLFAALILTFSPVLLRMRES